VEKNRGRGFEERGTSQCATISLRRSYPGLRKGRLEGGGISSVEKREGDQEVVSGEGEVRSGEEGSRKEKGKTVRAA